MQLLNRYKTQNPCDTSKDMQVFPYFYFKKLQNLNFRKCASTMTTARRLKSWNISKQTRTPMKEECPKNWLETV